MFDSFSGISEKKGKMMDIAEIARKLQLALPPIVQTTTIHHDTDEYVSANTNSSSSVKRQWLETALNSRSNKNSIKELKQPIVLIYQIQIMDFGRYCIYLKKFPTRIVKVIIIKRPALILHLGMPW